MKNKRILRIREEENLFANEPQQKEKQQKIQKITNRRYLVLFSIFSVLITIIVSQLYLIQVVQHDKYTQMALTQFDETLLELSTRGNITDSNGEILVTNQEHLSFIYLEPKSETSATKWEKAVLFVETFDMDLSYMTIRDKQDAYIFLKSEEANALITEDERNAYARNELTDDNLYQMKLSRITASLIDSSLTTTELKQFYAYSIMQSAIGLDVILKEAVTAEEVNILLENLQSFSGIEVKPNWTRVGLGEHHLKSILGDMTTSRQGLLKDNYLLMQALDYKLNDRVGRSGLEQTYEEVLSGIRTKYSLTYDENGLAQMSEVKAGKQGDTIQMTISLEYQKNIEDIVANFVNQNAYNYTKEYFNQMYVVVSNPNNGDVLATVGIYKDKDGEIQYIPSGTYLNAFMVGSSIKGAVVYLALDSNIFYPGEIVIDEPLKIQGTPLKGSFVNLGPVDDLKALSHSSNVYMFKAAIKLGNAVYEYDEPLDIDQSAFGKVRANFSQFGLGVETGLDVPTEETGYKSPSLVPGLLLDYVIGQYDSYTAMQLNQYVATIANGQYRYKLRIVTHSYDSETGLVNYQNPVTILNAIDNEMAIGRVQTGFRLCVINGYCDYLADADLETAAKTGSAEDHYYDRDRGLNLETTSNTMVAYAPYNNPEIAISCIAPHYINNENAREYIENGCQEVVKEIINYHSSQSK